MSVFLNRQAAELLEIAAKSHRRAADFLELGDTKGCTDYADEGFDRASFAVETSRDAARQSVEITRTSRQASDLSHTPTEVSHVGSSQS